MRVPLTAGRMITTPYAVFARCARVGPRLRGHLLRQTQRRLPVPDKVRERPSEVTENLAAHPSH